MFDNKTSIVETTIVITKFTIFLMFKIFPANKGIITPSVIIEFDRFMDRSDMAFL